MEQFIGVATSIFTAIISSGVIGIFFKSYIYQEIDKRFDKFEEERKKKDENNQKEIMQIKLDYLQKEEFEKFTKELKENLQPVKKLENSVTKLEIQIENLIKRLDQKGEK